jgi:hypothetical protein
VTLVVARKVGKTLAVVCDTEITMVNGEFVAPTQGVVKAHIVSPELCVCFAGGINYAEEAIKGFSLCGPRNPSTGAVVGHFLDKHTESRQQVDFILAIGRPNYELVQIKQGRAENMSASWLGSHSAFERFQQYMVCAPRGAGRQELCEAMCRSMQEVILDSDVKGVGGFCIGALCTGDASSGEIGRASCRERVSVLV